MKILVVDDSLPARKLLIKELNALDYTDTVEAVNGKEALDILKQDSAIKLVFLDRYMPVMDGLEFIKTFKSKGGEKFVTIVMVTSEDDKEEIVKTLMDYKADYYITKPATSQSLMAMFSELFN